MMEENSQNKFKRICVFCGSSSGNRTVFSDAALDLGHELVKRKIDLVYGGGSVGLMGLISKTVHDGGCHVLGVIPTALLPLEISGETVGELKSVSDMHGRKAEMARQADAFIALPGGYGTMEEMLEMITWSQLGIHSKPVGLLNVDGYYNSLLALFDNGVAEGFIKPADRHIVLSATTAEELIVKMEGPPLGDFREEIGKVKIHVIGISTFRTTKHCALSVEVDFTEQYVPLHEQVAPLTSWESGRRGYSTQPNTP